MRPIDADALVAKMKAYDIWHETEYQDGYFDGFSDGISEVEEAPTIEAELVKHGRWIRPEGYCWRPECSECGYYGSAIDEPVIPFNYCPHCGAKMDLEET